MRKRKQREKFAPTILSKLLYTKRTLRRDFDQRIKFKHGVIICAGTREDTVYVNLNKTIQTFWHLTLPLPAINVA